MEKGYYNRNGATANRTIGVAIHNKNGKGLLLTLKIKIYLH